MFFIKSAFYILFVASGCLVSWGHIVACDLAKFTEIKKDYFKRLSDTGARGYRYREKIDLLASNCAKDYKTSNHKSLVGEIFVYDALLKINDLRTQTESNKSHAPDVDQILTSIQYLELAREVRPDDKRIPGWLQGANASLYRIKREPITDLVLQKAIAAIDARPTFNLWTAILIFRDQDPTRDPFEQLLSKSKDFADLMRGSDNPCLKFPTDCQNSPTAPNNFSSAILTLADVFIRASNKRLHQGNIPEAMMFAGYAKGTLENIASRTSSLFEYRMNLVSKLFQRQPFIDSELVANELYQQPYSCKACHVQ